MKEDITHSVGAKGSETAAEVAEKDPSKIKDAVTIALIRYLLQNDVKGMEEELFLTKVGFSPELSRIIFASLLTNGISLPEIREAFPLKVDHVQYEF
jgi:hypothetical protein